MTQSTNNQILLKTLAFCAAVAGVGAAPAMADYGQSQEDFHRQANERYLQQRDMRNLESKIRWEMNRQRTQMKNQMMRGY